MYKGEINVGQEQLPLLLQAAETLQVRKHYIIKRAVSRYRAPGKTHTRFMYQNKSSGSNIIIPCGKLTTTLLSLLIFLAYNIYTEENLTRL